MIEEIKQEQSFICEHDYMRRKCLHCEINELYKEVESKDNSIKALVEALEAINNRALVGIDEKDEYGLKIALTMVITKSGEALTTYKGEKP